MAKAKKPRASSARISAAERREQFVVALLGDPKRNATKAAIAAGFSKKTAYAAGSRLLKHVEVARILKLRQAEVVAKAMEKVQLTQDEVIESLARDIRFDPAKLYNADGSMKLVTEMDADTRRALRGLEAEEIRIGGTVLGHINKVKFPEVTAAREQGMKHFGLYELDNKQKPGLTVQVGVLTVQPEGLNFEKVRARALTKRAA